MSTIHITPGGSAADSLRAALARLERDEPVVELRDDLAFGPLRWIDDDPPARAEFWERVLPGAMPDWPAELERENDKLAALAAGSGQVVIWHAQSAADQLLLRRIAYHLRYAPQRLNEVRLSHADLDDPPRWLEHRADGATAVGMFAPERLRDKLNEAAPISVLRIGRLALEWQDAKLANAELRYWIGNMFKSGHYAELDALIVDHAPAEWDAAARTIGAVMALDLPGHLFVSDSIVLWRCRELAAAGRIELQGGELRTDTIRSVTLRATLPPAASR